MSADKARVLAQKVADLAMQPGSDGEGAAALERLRVLCARHGLRVVVAASLEPPENTGTGRWASGPDGGQTVQGRPTVGEERHALRVVYVREERTVRGQWFHLLADEDGRRFKAFLDQRLSRGEVYDGWRVVHVGHYQGRKEWTVEPLNGDLDSDPPV